MVQVAQPNPCLFQAISDRLGGQPRPMLHPPKALLFRGGHELPIPDEAGCGIRMIRIKPEYNHTPGNFRWLRTLGFKPVAPLIPMPRMETRDTKLKAKKANIAPSADGALPAFPVRGCAQAQAAAIGRLPGPAGKHETYLDRDVGARPNLYICPLRLKAEMG